MEKIRIVPTFCGDNLFIKKNNFMITLLNTQKALKEIEKFTDLRKFQIEKAKEFCEKYKIQSGQLNFLISVVAVGRIKI
jgi:inorganic pyrophosphatase